ncbi:SDR family NAD(P)-dependent oxidoreductase [Streptomyces sp. NBC_00385]|uniref:SDR family NAD(P)-dependent oxidoreductase n=1 Tax=Streptomyces sp. NBC_00385 TaxID=2975733 RepID=UPI002DD99C8B|nr:SDR family oxidoreductase [Streptomyces sp. NBC_00385]WRZ08460.1 SDR family oxidoreductase [Streptomyces sp. NBC_00385]
MDDDVETLFAGVEDALAGRSTSLSTMRRPRRQARSARRPGRSSTICSRSTCERRISSSSALQLMPEGGRIITISSVATRMAHSAQTSFAMTKAAVETMSRTLANQLGARGITVNAVAPGATRTPANGAVFGVPGLTEQITAKTALDRLGGPDDVADVVAFLASGAARWVTGQVIDASGGLFLGPRV